LRKSILIVLALALLAGSASAKLGDLVASFPNPGYTTYTHYGLAADANYLYSFLYYSTWSYPVMRMRRSNGAFVSSYRIQGPSYPQYTRGVSYDGTGYLYYCNYSRRYVTRARADTGSYISTWTWPSGTRYGICADHRGTSPGTYIYMGYTTGDFWKHRLTGSLVSSWSMPNYTYNYDLAWDYGNYLIWSINYSTDWIYSVDPNTQRIVESFRHPRWASISSCYGIAYWGQYLYVSNSGGTPDEYIWVFDCPNTVGVTPASVGKVKALFK
jgi:hypothetical protein